MELDFYGGGFFFVTVPVDVDKSIAISHITIHASSSGVVQQSARTLPRLASIFLLSAFFSGVRTEMPGPKRPLSFFLSALCGSLAGVSSPVMQTLSSRAHEINNVSSTCAPGPRAWRREGG